jgi:iron complex outermembrane receptor protein
MKKLNKIAPFALRLLGSTMLVAVGAVYAQGTALAQNAAGASDDGAVQEIVVTAQKRSENMQTVPISIQALTPETLEQHQVQSFDDYTKLLPSVSFQSLGPGESQLFFRGIASGKDGLPFGALPTSGVYLDETPVTTVGSLLDVHMYDMARVEALSGPQGTLFGASSLAGTLRIITNKPNPAKFEAGYDVEANKFGDGGPGGSVQGFVNIPLTDKIAVRIVAFEEADGGYIDNTLGSRTYQRPYTAADGSTATSPLTVTNAGAAKNDFNSANTYGGRVALGIELNEDWTITPQFMGQDQHTDGTFLYDPHAGYLKVHDFLDGYSIDKWYQASLTVNGKIFDWDFLYAGGYAARNNVALQDYSYYTVAYDHFPNYTYFQNKNGQPLSPNQFVERANSFTKDTQEVRLSSPTGQRLQVTTGLFFERQSDDFRADYLIPGIAQSPQAAGYYMPGTDADVFLSNATIVDRDYAVFGQGDFKILPDLTLTAGIRGFEYRNSVIGFSGGAGTVQSLGCGASYSTNCVSIDKSANGSGETHKLNLSWQIDPDRMVYTTYSTGFRPGGINRPLGYAPYNPDTLDNYELGWKTSWLNRMLRFNGAVYHEVWNGVQYSLPGANGVASIVNAGNAAVDGVETDIQARLGRLTLSSSGAYNNARLTTPFCDMINGVSHCELGMAAPSGTQLPVQPQFKDTSTARYSFDVGAIAAYTQLSMLYQSGSTSLLSVGQNAALGNTAPFKTFDLAIGGATENDLTFEFYIQNMFDDHGALSRNSQCVETTCFVNGRTYPIKPQLFGVKFGQRF